MDRLKLIGQLLHECTTTASIVSSFLNTPQKYASDDSLYMREAHFVVAIGPEGRPTMSEMAERLNVTQGAITQMATRLEKKGYVVREKSSTDRRQTTISLTEKGKTLCAEHIAFDSEEHRRGSERLSEFSDEELALFIHYEQSIRALFTKRE